jgi:hypothetical protein
MGLPPTGEIVARPMVARACGCKQEFQHYAVDKYRAQRLAKFQQTRCPACVAKLVEEQRRSAPPPKAEALKMLPAGAQVALTLKPDGSWAGSLTADKTTVDLAGAAGAGPQAVVGELARLWIIKGGAGDKGQTPKTK